MLQEWGSGSTSLEASSKYLHGLFGIFLHERSVSSPHYIISPVNFPCRIFCLLEMLGGGGYKPHRYF